MIAALPEKLSPILLVISLFCDSTYISNIIGQDKSHFIKNKIDRGFTSSTINVQSIPVIFFFKQLKIDNCFTSEVIQTLKAINEQYIYNYKLQNNI